MKILSVVVLSVAMVASSTPAAAGELLASAAKVTARAEAQSPAERRTMSKTVWPGAALFVGGMAVALNGFLNNRNGQFPEFGEAESTNVKMGAAGLAAAFGGGVLLFLGTHGGTASVTAGPGQLSAVGRVRW
jgi:hypothetical protein